MLTTEQLAEKLGITTGRVRQLAIAGRIIGAHKVGRDWTFTKGARVRLAEKTKRDAEKNQQR